MFWGNYIKLQTDLKLVSRSVTDEVELPVVVVTYSNSFFKRTAHSYSPEGGDKCSLDNNKNKAFCLALLPSILTNQCCRIH